MAAVVETTGKVKQQIGLSKDDIIIIGAGPVGMHAAKELLRHDVNRAVTVFGEEPWDPYNRVKLSSLLAGELSFYENQNAFWLPALDKAATFSHRRIVEIDRTKRAVVDDEGTVHPYQKLIIATGSRAHVPHVEGVTLDGVYTLRKLDDAQALTARRVRARRVVVIGGGLLGLETAKAMLRFHTEVMVVEHAPRIMPRQLNDQAAEVVREHLMRMGIKVYLRDGVKRLHGGDKVSHVELISGRCIACDTVVFATGIVPQTELAQQAGLHIGRGIKVNNTLQTSDPDIYAVGECAEHNGVVYGIVAPGFEQAAVAATHIYGDKAVYHGSRAATHLKVVGQKVFSMGEVADDAPASQYETHEYREQGKHVYRVLYLKNRRLTGAIAIGPWKDLGRIQECIENRRRPWPWQLWRFKRSGQLWPEQDTGVRDWPAKSVVCNCTGVTRGQLSQRINNGCRTLDGLKHQTGASTVCGTCRPLLVQLLGDAAASVDVPKQRLLLTMSMLVLVFLIYQALTPPVPFAPSVQTMNIDSIWRNDIWKQVTGYTVVGVSLLSLVLSLRKRWKRFAFWRYEAWRHLHAGVNTAAIVSLILHTGLHMGSNINFMLMVAFLMVLLTGGMIGAVQSLQSRFRPAVARALSTNLNTVHLALLFPYLILVGFHIVAFYYF